MHVDFLGVFMKLKVFAAFLIICCAAGCGNETGSAIADQDETAPVIQAITVVPDTILAGESCLIKCIAVDENGAQLTYEWSTSGNIAGSGSSVYYTPNSCCGQPQIIITVSNGRNSIDTVYNVPFRYDD